MFRAIGRFLSGLNHKYIKPWFFSSEDPGRIKSPYVISFIFLSMTALAIGTHIWMKMWQFREIIQLWNSNGVEALPQIEALAKVDMSLLPLITVLIGAAGLFIGLYNWGKTGKAPAASAVSGDDDNSESPSGDGKIKENEI